MFYKGAPKAAPPVLFCWPIRGGCQCDGSRGLNLPTTIPLRAVAVTDGSTGSLIKWCLTWECR